MSVDVVAAVVALLKDDDAVSSATSDRVYGGELPRAQNEQMPRTAVIVIPAGGGLIGRAYQDYRDTRVDVICYGATLHQADRLYADVRSALRELRRTVVTGVLLHWANESAGMFLARDPETQWPTAFGSFQILAADVAA